MNLSSQFSPHNDVLNATPSTTPAKITLIEELKRRGRVSVISKRYPDAKDLYTKAIDTLISIPTNTNTNTNDKDVHAHDHVHAPNSDKDLAILYSNRSLCNLQMNIPSDSYDDALNATCNDSTYVKGFWRLGQASMALKRTEEALIAYEKAYALDGGNKALKKEVDKAKKQLELEKKLAEEEALRKEKEEKEKNTDKPVSKPVSKPKPSVNSDTNANTKPPVTKSSSSSTTSSSTSSSTKEEKKETSSGPFSKSDHVKGYKIVNGKKTSFFHHEQTEEEKRLIGDITPKRLDTTTTDSTNLSQQNNAPVRINTEGAKSGKGTSVWNSAGTWEEKDVTDWAIQTLTDKVKTCTYNLPDGSPDPKACVKVTKVSKLISAKIAGGTCHASVAAVRGKKKFIFEFTFDVNWEMTLGDGSLCKGSMTFVDVDGTHEMGDGYDVSNYSVDSDTPSDARYLLERFVRDAGLRNVIEKAMDEWITLFRETYS